MSSAGKDRHDKPAPHKDPARGSQDTPENPCHPPSPGPTSSCDCDQIICLLDKIARTTCLTANEVHRNGRELKSIAASLHALTEMYRTANPAAALDYERQEKLRAQIEECCLSKEQEDDVCKYVPCPPSGGARRGDG